VGSLTKIADSIKDIRLREMQRVSKVVLLNPQRVSKKPMNSPAIHPDSVNAAYSAKPCFQSLWE